MESTIPSFDSADLVPSHDQGGDPTNLKKTSPQPSEHPEAGCGEAVRTLGSCPV